jgi:hypothetical protein
LNEIGDLLKQTLAVGAQGFTGGHEAGELTLALRISREEMYSHSERRNSWPF